LATTTPLVSQVFEECFSDQVIFFVCIVIISPY
jgi:hypothetical protein